MSIKLLRSIGVCLLLCFTTSSIATAAPISQTSSNILYVKQEVSGSDDCSNWENACGLQAALEKASSGQEIWVAAGTYRPTEPISSLYPKNSPTFNLETGVAIYGGFPAEGGDWGDRDPATHLTTLSGELGLPSDDTDNSFHVVTANGVDETAILDGFTIREGRATGSVGGGGMTNRNGSSPTLNNLIFFENTASYGGGGGMKNEGGCPKLTNVSFINNFAYIGGAGMYNSYSNPILTNISFIGNETERFGGGMLNESSNPTLTNVTFSSNKAGVGGGMANLDESEPFLTNVTFTGNSARASFGGAIDNRRTSLTMMTNVIVWGNIPAVDQISNWDDTAFTLASYSIIEGGFAGETNLASDPSLMSLADNGGFTQTHALSAGSPAIGAANPSSCPETDQRGNLRLKDGKGNVSNFCDIGAYEFGYTLAVEVQGQGSVTKTPDRPDYKSGELVTLDAIPAADWSLENWSGDLEGNANPEIVLIDGDKAVTAHFKQTRFWYILFPLYKQ